MPKKIKNLTNNFIDFVFNNWIKIAIVVSTLAWLFLFGHVFGINQEISALFNEFWNYISNRKSLTIQTLLAIGSTISAIFAVVISVRANRISKIALETEAPKLIFDYARTDERKPYSFKISNMGNSDALNCKFQVINKKKEIKYLDEYKNISISAGISNVELFFAPNDDEKQAIIVTYTNSNSGKMYKRGFEIKLSGTGAKQIGLKEDSVLSFQEYLNI